MAVELTSRIGEITKLATKRAKENVTRTCMEVEAGAKRNLIENQSVITGNLIASIDADTDGFDGEVGTAVTYAPFVEFGTGERGAASRFPGKPEGLTYTLGGRWETRRVSMAGAVGGGFITERFFNEDWKGAPAKPYLIPALEAAREGFEMRAGGIYR